MPDGIAPCARWTGEDAVTRRYTTLEGMRGVAAVCVVLWHADSVLGPLAPPGAYLAVDFFFVLSGFIVAHAYGEALQAGLGAAAFLRARLVRLYPMYLLGTLSAVALAAMPVLAGRNDVLWTYTDPPVSLPLGLLMLPSPASPSLFPLNVPAWSLLLELVANAAFATRLFRRRRTQAALVAASAVALVAGAATFGSVDFGWNKANAAWGLARVFFGFPLGVLLYRVRPSARIAGPGSAASVAVLAVLLFVPVGPGWRAVFDLLFVAAVSPALVLSGAAWQPRHPWLAAVYLFLGAVSYPLYALHHPVLIAACVTIIRRLQHGPAATVAALAVVVALVAVARAAAVLDRRAGLAAHRLFARGARRPASPAPRSASG